MTIEVVIKVEILYIRGIYNHEITNRAYVNKSKYCSNLTFTM